MPKIILIIICLFGLLFFYSINSYKKMFFFDSSQKDITKITSPNKYFDFVIKIPLNCVLESNRTQNAFLSIFPHFVFVNDRWVGEFVCKNKSIRQRIKIQKIEDDFSVFVGGLEKEEGLEVFYMDNNSILYSLNKSTALFFVSYCERKHLSFSTNFYIKDVNPLDYFILSDSSK
ncbi:MAG: hypothetical protein ABII02_02130 [Candidatus Magasanikbacteria bacterium]